MESCSIVKILSLPFSCQLPIFQSHQLDLLLISCPFVECATPCNLSTSKCGRSVLEAEQHEIRPVLEFRKFRFCSKAGPWLLLLRKPLILYLLLKHTKSYNIRGSNLHFYSNISTCHQDFSITSLWRMAKKSFCSPEIKHFTSRPSV